MTTATLQIVKRASKATGDFDRALNWYKTRSLPGFAGKTAQKLVESGRSHVVLHYLTELENGASA